MNSPASPDCDLPDEFAAAAARAPFVARIARPRHRFDRFDALRGYYRLAAPEIAAEPAHRWALDPYEVDWLALFTPIECALWADIRITGAVLYPQFPVGRYFADFANPRARVVVECDGAAFHVDAAKDAARQRDIEALGWTVYRLTGKECVSLPSPRFDDDGAELDGEEPSMATRFVDDIAARHALSGRHADRLAAANRSAA